MWVAAQLLPHKEALALHCLKLNGYPTTYLPRVRERRVVRRRVVETARPLFPGYAFVVVESQWHRARWSPGIAGLIMDGAAPARVADSIIAELRSREINGLVELPPGLKAGDRVRVTRGPFAGLGGLCAGMTGGRACRGAALASRRVPAGCPAGGRCRGGAPGGTLISRGRAARWGFGLPTQARVVDGLLTSIFSGSAFRYG
ncbi:MAG: transcription termination/antitermination protein NusG [Microvirga sp.]|jgi:transcriptional antiterminator RfaH